MRESANWKELLILDWLIHPYETISSHAIAQYSFKIVLTYWIYTLM